MERDPGKCYSNSRVLNRGAYPCSEAASSSSEYRHPGMPAVRNGGLVGGVLLNKHKETLKMYLLNSIQCFH